MKIALVFPTASLRRGTRLKNVMIPPHCLQIVSSLTPPEHEVVIYDEYNCLAPHNIQADLVGISVWTAAANRAYHLADLYRNNNRPVVLGGPHVTICPEEAQNHADSLVVGEAEAVWKDLLQDFQRKQLKKRYFGKSLPLTETPDADWERIHGINYVLMSSILASRGCVNRCAFCFESSRSGESFRQRPLDMVLRELDRCPSQLIAVLDNDPLANRDYAISLLKALSSRKIQWSGMTTIGAADDENMLDLLVESGCRTLFIGFESINRDCLAEAQKGWNHTENYLRNVKRMQARDIIVNGGFVFGFDGDDPTVFERTVQFGMAAKLETATFTILTPYPGTLLYKKLDASGRIFDRDWSHYDTTHAVFHPQKMSAKELESGYFWAYKAFYSWTSILPRCRFREPGYGKRFLLNAAYKKVEPLYWLFGRGVKAGWGRWIMHWFAKRKG